MQVIRLEASQRVMPARNEDIGQASHAAMFGLMDQPEFHVTLVKLDALAP